MQYITNYNYKSLNNNNNDKKIEGKIEKGIKLSK